MQKSDLNHLYPTDSRTNGVRGSYEFANVQRGGSVHNCAPSRTEKGGKQRFEPAKSVNSFILLNQNPFGLLFFLV